jgi:hypothetical protein
MALVGNISGSGGTYSTIGITGSVIFAYTDTPSAFPTLPSVGGDVVFFVSGSTTGKDGAVRNVAVFGGDTVVSGSLTIGSGSVKLTSNDIQFSAFGTRIERNGNDLKFFDGNNTGGLTLSSLNSGGGGGGGGSNFFFDTAGAGKIYTTASSVAFRAGENIDEAADKGTDVVFFVSGSKLPNTAVALFSGRLITSGNILVRSDTESALTPNAISLSNLGVISGSSNLLVGGGITVAGNIDTDLAGAKTLFATAGLNTITIGGTTSTVVANGTLQVNGNITADANEPKKIFELVSSNNIEIGGVGSTVVVDALTVGGGFGTSGVTISSAGGISADGNVIIGGDLTVNGTTTTLNTANLLVEDPVIYFGSGSVTSNQPGGIALASGSSVTHQALVWGRVGNDTWGAGRLDVQNGTVTDFSTLTNYLPIRASKFEVGLSPDSAGATRAFVSSSLGTDLILSGTNSVTVGSTIINFQRSDSTYATLNGTGPGTGTIFSAASGRTLTVGTIGQTFALSGSSILLNAASAGSFSFQRDNTTAVALSAPIAADQPQLVASQNNGKFTIGTSGGTGFLALSGSAVKVNTSDQGFQVQRDGTQVLVISGTNDGSVLAAASVGASPSSLTLTLTGSAVTVGSTSATNFNFAGGTALQLLGDATSATVAAGTSRTTANVFNTVATTVNAFGAAATLNVGNASAAQTISIGNASTDNSTYNLGTGATANTKTKAINIGTGGDAGSTTNITLGSGNGGTTAVRDALTVDGNTTLGNANSDTITFTARAASNLEPTTDSLYDLGSVGRRWKNIYTGDLHLRNDRGNWTIIEEREFLSITNNITGKRYKFVLQEIE